MFEITPRALAITMGAGGIGMSVGSLTAYFVSEWWRFEREVATFEDGVGVLKRAKYKAGYIRRHTKWRRVPKAIAATFVGGMVVSALLFLLAAGVHTTFF